MWNTGELPGFNLSRDNPDITAFKERIYVELKDSYSATAKL